MAASVLLSITASVLPHAVLANPFPGDNGDFTVADSSLHTYCWDASMNLQEERDVAEYAMVVLVDTTDMTVDLVNCSGDTDVWWYSLNLPAGIRGLRGCVDYVNANVCNSADVAFDLAEFDVGPNDWQDRRKTSVHELGHSIGLGHNENVVNAMISGEIDSDSIDDRRYTNHDVNHINIAY